MDKYAKNKPRGYMGIRVIEEDKSPLLPGSDRTLEHSIRRAVKVGVALQIDYNIR